MRRILIGAGLALVPLLIGGPASASGSANDAADWLLDQRRDNGAFGHDDQPADQLAESINALVVAGIPATDLSESLDRLAAIGPSRASEQAAYAARITIALVTIGEDPRNFRGTNYVEAITDRYNPLLATHGGNIYGEALAGVGRSVSNEPVPEAFVERLTSSMCPKGGWSWRDRCTGPPDADTTAMVLTLLALEGFQPGDPSVSASLEWLKRIQHGRGAFRLEEQAPINSNSTGLVAVALATLGEDPRSFNGRDAVASLELFVTPSGGLSYMQDGPANFYSTVQALPAMFAAAYPFAPRPPAPEPSGSSPVTVPRLTPLPSPVPTVEIPDLPFEVHERVTAEDGSGQSTALALTGGAEDSASGAMVPFALGAVLAAVAAQGWFLFHFRRRA